MDVLDYSNDLIVIWQSAQKDGYDSAHVGAYHDGTTIVPRTIIFWKQWWWSWGAQQHCNGLQLNKCAPIKQGSEIGYDFNNDLDDDSDDNHHHYYDIDDDGYKVHLFAFDDDYDDNVHNIQWPPAD